MRIAVLTDSTAYLPKHLVDAQHIHIVHLSVIFGEEAYQEELDLSTEAFYQRMRSEKELPKTSQPPIGAFLEAFKRIRENYDACICIHLSSGISGTYQSAVSAGEMMEGLVVRAFDSEISCMVQGYYAIEAAKLAEQGASLDEIMARLDQMKESMKAYFMVNDLGNLQKGGRLSNTQALVGSLLQVKPILNFDNKVIVPFEKIRTKKKALARIIGMLEEDAKRVSVEQVTFIHANDLESAKSMRRDFEEKYPEVKTDISHFGPVIGTHLGEGALGVGWYWKN